MEAKQLLRIILILLLGFLCVTGYAQKKETVEELSKRIEDYSKTIKDLENKLKTIIEGYDAQLRAIKKKIQIAELNEGVKSAKEGIKDTRTLLYWIFGIIVGAFVGLYTYFVNKYHKSRMRAEMEIREKIAHYFDTEERNLIQMVEEADLNSLKNKSSILVLSPVNSDVTFFRKFFINTRFTNVDYQYIDNISNLNKANLVLFNNDDGKFDHKEILEIIKKTRENVFCFYFGQGRFESGEYKDRVSFANTKLQLYGNLINALRYQEFMK
jgi:hypothetical protein